MGKPISAKFYQYDRKSRPCCGLDHSDDVAKNVQHM